MLAVFAVLSCKPAVDVTEYDWENANAQNQSLNNGNIALPFADDPYIYTTTNPQITITFPNQADVLRASNIDVELKKFLTFHTFTSPASEGNASTLSAAIPYKFITTNGSNEVTVELERVFTGAYSDIVAKFDGNAYTHSRGIKMDVDRDGTGGVTGYDDYYIRLEFNSGGTDDSTWVAPGHKGWELDIDWDDFSGVAFVAINRNSQSSTVLAIELNLNGIPTDTENGKAIYKAAGEQFAAGFKLQKRSDTSWADVKTAEYDAGIIIDGLVFKDVFFDHATAYRVAWSGSANLLTNGTYFGVQQKVRVVGGLPELDSYRHGYSRTQASSTNSVVINNPYLLQEITDAPTVSIVHVDPAILKFEFEIFGSTGLKQLPLSSFLGVDAAFKIVYGDPENYSFASISDISFAKEGDGIVHDCFNVLYVTLSHSEQLQTNFGLLINDTFAYTGDSPKRVFGDAANLDGGYRFYNHTNNPNQAFLFDGVWQIGSISLDLTATFIFNVTGGRTYRIWWNDYYQGNGTKTLDVRVSAYYLSGDSIFTNIDSGYTTPRSFTASEDDVVIVTVAPFYAGYTGTFGIVYTVDNSTRPSL